jgi:TrmH family RNA methyltransferase
LIPTLGRHHPTIRRLRALRRDPALRRKERVLIAEGIHLAHAALESSARIELALFSPPLSARAEGRELLRVIEERDVSRAEVEDTVLDSLQDARSPQPILMLVRRTEWAADAPLAPGDDAPLIVVAAGIQDPGNLGSLVRTADAAGATACFVTKGSTDAFHPRAVRATMGAIFRLPVLIEPEGNIVELFRERGLRLIGTAAREGTDYNRCDLAGPTALFFGGEGAGLSATLRAEFDENVRVPMSRTVDSLSVGAAAAVILFEAAKQRRTGRSGR